MSDLDGVFERNGHLLIYEFKSPGVQPSAAQLLVLVTLASKEDVTVVIVWGEKDCPQQLAEVTGEELVIKDTSLEDLRRRTARWFVRANPVPGIGFSFSPV